MVLQAYSAAAALRAFMVLRTGSLAGIIMRRRGVNSIQNDYITLSNSIMLNSISPMDDINN